MHGQWVSNRSPAVGAAPGLCTQQQFGSSFMGGVQSHNTETFRRPYDDASPAPDFGHHTYVHTLAAAACRVCVLGC